MVTNSDHLITLTHCVTVAEVAQRLDVVLSKRFPQYSRAVLQKWIKAGQVTINQKVVTTPNIRLLNQQQITIKAIPCLVQTDLAQPIPLDILYQDDDLIVINKPAGLITHPGAGNPDNTLLNALLYHFPELQELPRAGIIHRLDKDTSGILVVAHSLTAHCALTRLLQERQIKREYLAVVHGQLLSGGTIDANIGRHPQKRTLMAVINQGKPAITHYRILQKFPFHTYIRVALETGRTHQIRVHFAHLGYPLVGDTVYSRTHKVSQKIPLLVRTALEHFPRQALHATRLALVHPTTQQFCEWEVPPPEDFSNLLTIMQQYYQL